MTPTLSIIIATYNSDKTLQITLNSLLNQTYKFFEIIIIDGLSTDNTVEIVSNNKKSFDDLNIPYYWISEKDSGIYDAWNKGLKNVNTNWVAFLGSDDYYLSNALELYNNEIDKANNINYISSKVEIIDAHNIVLRLIGKPYAYNQMNRFMTVAHVGSMHHISLFNTFGDFSTNYRIAGDYDFFIRCADCINAAFINQITAKMLNEGVSNQLIDLAISENLKIHLNHKKISTMQSYFEYYLSHFKKFIKKYILS